MTQLYRITSVPYIGEQMSHTYEPDPQATRDAALGAAVTSYLKGQTPDSLRTWAGLLHRSSSDVVPLHWTAGLFQAIAAALETEAANG